MNAKTLGKLLVIGCLVICLSGCKGGPAESFFKTGEYRFLSPDKTIARPDETLVTPIITDYSALDASSGPYPNAVRPTESDVVYTDTDYVIGVTDVLDISILDLYAEGLETLLRREVTESGYLDLPQLKQRIKAEGLTQYELTNTIKQAYIDNEILREPVVVSVTVVTRRQQTFSVTGACGRPGTYQFVRPDMRLWDALALAGGVTQPNIEYIYIIRHAPPTPESESDVDLSSPTGPPTDQVRLRRRRRAEPKKQTDLEAIGDLMGGAPTVGPMQVSSFAETAEGPGSGTVAPAPEGNGTTNGNGNGNGKLSRWVYRDGKWVRVTGDEAVQPATGAESAEPAEPAAPTEPEAPVEAPEPVEQPDPAENGSGVKPLEAMPAEPAAPAEPAEPTQPEPAGEPAPSEDQADPFGWSAMSGRDLVRVIAISRDKLEKGSYRENVVIRENDVVYIPPLEVGEFYVSGEVLRPGVYSLTGRQVTIKMALAAAGGVGPMGWPENSILIRRIGESQEQIIPINVERIWRGLDPDMMLKPDDVLAVGTHWSSTFLAVLRNAFRMTYGFGFIYDRNFSDPLFTTPKSNRFTAL
ncbi:MAG: hypothetical protein GVY16_03885 [Planctomycetes bacterium]|nr:SLBB domain-containing protein [Phycisphaerae bacterium]NBB94861.1 hypothetical protein [Planctomycetota bacterium]